jgi:serine protease
MNRCLHITIHEGSGGEPRTTKTGPAGYSRSDPGSDDFMPPLKDPGADDFMPPLKDPSDTPDHSYPTSHSGGCGTVVATAGCCCGCAGTAGSATAAPGSAAPRTSAGARSYSGFVIVRLVPGLESETAATLWHLADEKKLAGLEAVLERPGETDGGARMIALPPVVAAPAPPPPGTLVSRPLVELVARTDGDVKPLLARSESFSTLQKLEARTVFTAFPPRHSLNSYWRVDLRPYPGFVEEVVERLNRLAEVDLAYRELSAVDPAAGLAGKLLQDDQGYLGDAPVGIGASWAWKSLASLLAGQAARRPQTTLAPGTQLAPPRLVICDLEQGWTTDHLDLVPLSLNKPISLVYGANRAPAEGSTGDHGTAVLGQVAAAGNSPFGIRGAATEIADILLASHYRSKKETETVNTVVTPHPFAGTDGHVAAAIVQALSALPPFQPRNDGHILLLEVQRGYLPTEVDEADFDAIRLASGLGVLVVEAAGNGGFDLDAWTGPTTHRSLNRGDGAFRDSGAVVVGAARAALPHDRASFSNYGSRVDCFAWGEAVTTCGFGDLAGTGAKDAYTNKFNGTSSASPIIVGAAALLQTLHKTATAGTLSPQAMRSLLADPATGTRQGPNVPGAIGVMPDLEVILRRTLQIVPVVYQRRAPGDDGSVPGATDEISSSPDVFAWNGDLAAAKARYEGAQGALRDNVPAPGDPAAQKIYVRLRNRGLGPGDVQVQLFASPAATLITPERWLPVPATPNSFAGLPVNSVPQGGTPVVAGPFAWTPPPLPPVSAWSFLAVLRRPDEGPAAPANPPFFDWAVGLPPGGPYFRWEEFRAFLRRPGVAWRNVHRVTAANPILPFVIAGTPESAHVFDFELIQRLPNGATVELQVPAALAAKLRQRQPWLGAGTNPTSLSLPARPGLKIRGVELAAGTWADAAFKVTGSGLQAGHSLAIRQLWRGEVVGGITWFFGPEP